MNYTRTVKHRQAASEKQKMNWRDPTYRKRIISSHKQVWDRPGYREHQSVIRKGINVSPATNFKKGQPAWFMTKDYTPDKHPCFKGGKQAMSAIVREKYQTCQQCGLDDKRVLHIHHKDGNHKNNKLENLKMYCANCHVLTHYEMNHKPRGKRKK